MSVSVLIGAQWGDEGKGKIIDVLCENIDLVVRFQGGGNAGHTIICNGEKIVLHHIPSGIHRTNAMNVIGNGLVVNPVNLVKELDGLVEKGIDISDRFQISNRAHFIFNYHSVLDGLSEESLGDDMIGTTKRGIGPGYADKINRVGIRGEDLLDEEYFIKKFKRNLAACNKIITTYGIEKLDAEKELADVLPAVRILKKYITDTVLTVNNAVKKGQSILFEGAQGVWLDVDYGTYPYVTSSNTSVGSACTGGGIAPTHIQKIYGVTKAYTTRVGEGPFPTELHGEDGEEIRKLGGEFGATTGRPRRCGWLDAVSTSYAVMLNGITDIALTKLDVLDSLEEISICVAYEIDGVRVESLPASSRDLEKAVAIYETHPGWKSDTTQAQCLTDLPENAQKYLNRVEELIGAKITIISVGPDRDQTFIVTK